QFMLYESIKKIFKIPIICIFNKMDLVENINYLNEYIHKVDEPIRVTACEGSGISQVIDKLEEFKDDEKRNR
ncbi:MAG: GTP-binding protein, partial [Methanobacterium sp.]